MQLQKTSVRKHQIKQDAVQWALFVTTKLSNVSVETISQWENNDNADLNTIPVISCWQSDGELSFNYQKEHAFKVMTGCLKTERRKLYLSENFKSDFCDCHWLSYVILNMGCLCDDYRKSTAFILCGNLESQVPKTHPLICYWCEIQTDIN